jgi:hypothetical protein
MPDITVESYIDYCISELASLEYKILYPKMDKNLFLQAFSLAGFLVCIVLKNLSILLYKFLGQNQRLGYYNNLSSDFHG